MAKSPSCRARWSSSGGSGAVRKDLVGPGPAAIAQEALASRKVKVAEDLILALPELRMQRRRLTRIAPISRKILTRRDSYAKAQRGRSRNRNGARTFLSALRRRSKFPRRLKTCWAI